MRSDQDQTLLAALEAEEPFTLDDTETARRKGSTASADNVVGSVLRTLDAAAPWQWFHFKAILISGMGFFTDAYDLFMVSIITSMIGFVYHPEMKGGLPHAEDNFIKGTAFIGTFIGQVVFGVLGDLLGRKKVYGVTLIMMIGATIMSSLSYRMGKLSMIVVFCFWRFVLGVGIGGDYPLSAVITSEYASQSRRGMMIAMVFAMQGFGILAAALVAMVLLASFKSRILKDVGTLDTVWRLCVGLGALPAAATMYLRAQLPETPRYTVHVQQDERRAGAHVRQVMRNEQDGPQKKASVPDKAADRITWRDFHNYVMRPANFRVLLGTCSAWFLLDVAFYSQGLFNPLVMEAIGFVPKVEDASNQQQVYDKVFAIAAGNAVIAFMGTVPGYWAAVALIEHMGRKRMQMMGFSVMTLLLVILSATFNPLIRHALWLFMMLYSLTFFFANFGPNTTTFIIPGECFPTKFRSTAHGISAASGKLGAILGAFGFSRVNAALGTGPTLGLLSLFTAAGVLSTLLVPETQGRSLESLGEMTGAEREEDAAAAVEGDGMEMQRLNSSSHLLT